MITFNSCLTEQLYFLQTNLFLSDIAEFHWHTLRLIKHFWFRIICFVVARRAYANLIMVYKSFRDHDYANVEKCFI